MTGQQSRQHDLEKPLRLLFTPGTLSPGKAIPVQRVGKQLWADTGLPSSQTGYSMRNNGQGTGCRPPPTGKVKRLAFCACFLFPFSWDSRCRAGGDPRSSSAPNPQFQIKRLRPHVVNELLKVSKQVRMEAF